jgi:2-polyprenyl-3-methyl-5-hydroxy-6-metoxy-1,4-benzoquinol methylase
MTEHDQALAQAFDGQAARFERAPVQSDPVLLERLVRTADFPADALVLDVGCGPGLVSEALLRAGHRVLGVDLSPEMIDRAMKRCGMYGPRARFENRSLFDPALAGPFDAAISRFVLHHVTDPPAFIRRQTELLQPGGILVVCDHTTDPEPSAAGWHNEIERLRDRTHTRNLNPGQLVDLVAGAGLSVVRLVEMPFTLDFDEWFERGTPAASKEAVYQRLLAAPSVRGFRVTPLSGQRVRIDGWIALVRGVVRV